MVDFFKKPETGKTQQKVVFCHSRSSFPASLCGVLVFGSVSIPSASAPSASSVLSHTHNCTTHTHTKSCIQSCTRNFVTRNFAIHNLCQTQSIAHNLASTRNLVTHRQSFTNNFLSHAIFHTQLCHTHTHTHSTLSGPCAAGVAPCDIHIPFEWQAWH